jgi:hypothetical protein
MRFTDLVLRNNAVNGILIDDFNGDLSFIDSDITGNAGGAGIGLVNVRNPVGSRTLIGSSSLGSTNQILLNQIGIDILLTDPGSRQETLITDTQIGGVFVPVIPAVFLAGVGVRAEANGAGITMITDVIDNRGIQYNAGSGVFLRSRGGATHTANVFNADPATLNMDGNGTGVTMQVGDAGPASTLNVFVENITMNATVDGAGNILRNGAGTVVSGVSTDDGVLQSVVQNIQADTIGNGVTYSANNLNNFIAPTAANINTIFNRDLTFTTIVGTGASLVTGDGTYTDFSLVGTNLFNADTVTPAGVQGVNVAVTGDAGADPLDNRTQVTVAGTTVNNFLGAGMTFTANEDAHLLMNLTGNQVNGVGAGLVNTALPFFDGIRITGNDNSTVSAELIGNSVAASFDQGIQFDVNDTGGTMNIVLDSNTSFGNDFGEDAADDPIINATFIDILGQNNGDATTTLCVAMTGNAFGNTTLTNPPVFGPSTFENGGNGGVINIFGPFTPAAYGTVCQPAIDAEKAGTFGAF